jgi:hypothetical protein
MSNSDPTAGLALGCGFGVFLFFRGFKVLREATLVADTPRMPIRSLPMGFVHVQAKAQGAQLLQSPISHTSCCFFKVEIEEWRSQGNSKSWQHCCTDMDGYEFYAVDDTGRVLVDAHAAEYDLPMTAERIVGSSEGSSSSGGGSDDAELLKYVSLAQVRSMTQRMEHFVDKRLSKAGAEDNPQLQAKRQAVKQFFEAIPAAAETGKPNFDAFRNLLTATGPLKDPDGEQHRQELLQRMQLVEAAQNSGAMKIPAFHTQRASGRYRLREYLVLPGQEYQIEGTCMQNPAPADAADRNLIAKGRNEPTFLISVKSEVQVRTGLRGKAWRMILGGAALALGCLALLLARYKLY